MAPGAATPIAGFGPIRARYAPLELMQSKEELRGCSWMHVGHMEPPHDLPWARGSDDGRLACSSMLSAEPEKSRFFKMVKTAIQPHHHHRLAESSSNLPLNLSFNMGEAQNLILNFDVPRTADTGYRPRSRRAGVGAWRPLELRPRRHALGQNAAGMVPPHASLHAPQ